MYRIEVAPAAYRDLVKLKRKILISDLGRLQKAVAGLALEPRPKGVRKIKGSDNAYRIRIGKYRIVYDIYEKDKLVVILQIIRRSDTTYG